MGVTGRQFANLTSQSIPSPLCTFLHHREEVREERVDSTMVSTTEEKEARDTTLLHHLSLSTLIPTVMKCATDSAEREEREVPTMEAITEEREEKDTDTMVTDAATATDPLVPTIHKY